MTAPQQELCQAPGCGQPILAERLRRHPSTKTCSDDCRKAYRRDKTSRPARAQREAARAAEAARANGWQGVPCDHYLRLSCDYRRLKLSFDNSIPRGHTAASWLREMLVILMRTKGLRTWALNELVAVPEPWVRDDDVTLGNKEIRSRIPSCLWEDICQRAKREQAPSAASWLRKMVYRAVHQTAYWYPRTYDQWLALHYAALRAAGRADYYFHNLAHRLEPYNPDYHPLHVQDRRPSVPEHLLAALPPVRDQAKAYSAHLELVQAIIDRSYLSGEADLPASEHSYLSGEAAPPANKIWYEVEALESAGYHEAAETLRQEIESMLRQGR